MVVVVVFVVIVVVVVVVIVVVVVVVVVVVFVSLSSLSKRIKITHKRVPGLNRRNEYFLHNSLVERTIQEEMSGLLKSGVYIVMNQVEYAVVIFYLPGLCQFMQVCVCDPKGQDITHI